MAASSSAVPTATADTGPNVATPGAALARRARTASHTHRPVLARLLPVSPVTSAHGL